MGESYSGLNRQRVEIPAYSVATVEFFDVKPNYFRVTNQGAVKLFCSASRYPTENIYDFACDGGKIQLFADPHARNKLYLLNPSGSPVSAEVMSFYAPFDPLSLAFSSISLDFSGTSIETSTAISSFKTALPAGNNKIGKVEVTNEKDYTTLLNQILTALNTLNTKLADGEGVSY